MRAVSRCVLLLALLLATAIPAPASKGSAQGSVLLPGYEPAARVLYLTDQDLNGILGYVVNLGGPVRNGTAVRLRETSPEPVELDVIFYSSLDPPEPCERLMTNDADGRGESGTTSCHGARARYALVMMLYGFNATFTLSWG